MARLWDILRVWGGAVDSPNIAMVWLTAKVNYSKVGSVTSLIVHKTISTIRLYQLDMVKTFQQSNVSLEFQEILLYAISD